MSLLQFLEEEGLAPYVDSRLLRREIQESMDITEEELEHAALQLIRAGSGGSPVARAHYYEHLGGYELQDFNKYSSSPPTSSSLHPHPSDSDFEAALASEQVRDVDRFSHHSTAASSSPQNKHRYRSTPQFTHVAQHCAPSDDADDVTIVKVTTL